MKKLCLAIACLSTSALAAASTLEARALAMGGTGVASATPGAAPFFNPAMLSLTGATSKSQLVIPATSIYAAVDSDAYDAYENISDDDYINNIADAVDGINQAVATNDSAAYNQFASDFSSNTLGLNKQLGIISDQPVNLGLDMLFAGGSTSEKVGWAVYLKGGGQAEVMPSVTNCDRGLLKEYANVVANLDPADYATERPSYSCGGDTFELVSAAGELNDPSDQLETSLFVGQVISSEVGVSLSHAFAFHGQDIAVGVTPKFIKLTSQVAMPTLQNLDDDNYDLGDDLESSEAENNAFNIDIGVASRFVEDKLAVGLVVKNLLADSFKTAADSNGRRHEFDIKPQAAAGVAYNVGGFTVATDLDLTQNKSFFNDYKSQFLSVGVEYSVWNFLGLRAGTRTNLAESEAQIFTVGLGMRLVDFSVEYSEDNTAVVMQSGWTF